MVRQDLHDLLDLFFSFLFSCLRLVEPTPRRDETKKIQSPSAKKSYLVNPVNLVYLRFDLQFG